MRHLQAQPYIDVDMAETLLEHEVENGSAFVPGFLAYKVLILFSSPSATSQTYPAMVAKAKPSQSSVGRRPRSTAEKVAKSPPAKQWWYPANTANFLDDPLACAGSVTILTVNDIAAVEQDPALSVHFTVIPDAERLLLVDEAEDSQVTSLVQKLLCGETFKTEDFPGGDRSFCPKLEVRDTGQDEKGCPFPYTCGICDRAKQSLLKLKKHLLLETAKKGILLAQRGGTRRKNPASSQRETGHQNESDNGVTTPFFGNATLQQQETQSNVLVLYGDVLDVEPESYVLPPEIPSTFQYEVGSPVAWEKTNPNCYRSVGSVRSFHPSWNGNPSSKSKETSAPKGGEGAQQQENESVTARTPPPVENNAAQVTDFIQRTGTDNAGEYSQEDHDGGEQVRMAKKQTQSVGHESGQTSNLEVLKSGETLEKVSSPMADVEAIVKEINSEFPATEEDERYDSCKDDMSTDSQIQENQGNQVIYTCA
ncbi:hypothetical protein Bca52824_001183 [Brassica carinata]|uniref:Uncharacterized protein n=1 Tax=Brassica carinata TaxID=52824 RepID=A0A8X7WFK7_BRACI|nr:hypothetical protein Bca52824_001183 [Brassica carinata]